MTPRRDGALVHPGRVGHEVSVDEAQDAARLAALRALAALEHSMGSLDDVVQVLHMNVLMACTADFTEHSVVADAASLALTEVLGQRAHCARTAFGVSSLPGGSSIEINLIAARGRSLGA